MGNVFSSCFHDGVGILISEIAPRYCVVIGTEYICKRLEQRYRSNSTVIAYKNERKIEIYNGNVESSASSDSEFSSSDEDDYTPCHAENNEPHVGRGNDATVSRIHARHKASLQVTRHKHYGGAFSLKPRIRLNAKNKRVKKKQDHSQTEFNSLEMAMNTIMSPDYLQRFWHRGYFDSYEYVISTLPIICPSAESYEDIFSVCENVFEYYRTRKHLIEISHNISGGVKPEDDRQLCVINTTEVVQVPQNVVAAVDSDAWIDANPEFNDVDELLSFMEQLPIDFDHIFECGIKEFERVFRRFRLEKYFTITDDPDMITLDDDQYEKRFKMYCGHVISADSMAIYLESVVIGGSYLIACPSYGCTAVWPYSIVRFIASSSYSRSGNQQRLQHLDILISENFLKIRPCVMKCPWCQTWCYKQNADCICVECPVCTRDNKTSFRFCWICLRQWNERECDEGCGNEDCKGIDRRIKILEECDTGIISNQECPSVRACPNCGVLSKYTNPNNHPNRCQLTMCKACRYKFCFLCVKTPSEGAQCDAYNTRCVAAGPQTRFADRIVVKIAHC